jgi:hypothetical protein
MAPIALRVTIMTCAAVATASHPRFPADHVLAATIEIGTETDTVSDARRDADV